MFLQVKLSFIITVQLLCSLDIGKFALFLSSKVFGFIQAEDFGTE